MNEMEQKRTVGRPKKSVQISVKKTAKPASSAKKTAKPASSAKKPQGDIIFALDIGTRTIVGVLAKKTQTGCEIIDIETVAHEKRCMNDGQIEDIKTVSDEIKLVRRALEERNRISLKSACIAAAGRALKTVRSSFEYKLSAEKLITDEILGAAELDAVRRTCAEFSAKNEAAAFYCVGHSVISLLLDGFKVTKPEGHRGECLTTEIIAAFLPAYVVESLCAAVDEAGLEIAGITLEPIAAMNAVIPQELRLINLALCDIGAGTSDVAVSRDGSVVAYGMATTAGDEITEALMKKLLVDFNTAEMIKTSALDDITYTDILLRENTISRSRVLEIIEPAAEELARVIAREIVAANAKPPQAVFLVGGGSKLEGLPERVAAELGMDASRIIAGKRELLRRISAPETFSLGAEHTTPLGIALTHGEGVSYDYTTITVNGKKLRALDTNRLTVFELLNFAKITPEELIAGAGKPLSFTLNGEKITLRGKPAKPSEILVNGEISSLNTVVTKGDEVVITPAKRGENASARLSDYFDLRSARAFNISVFGEKQRAGFLIMLNGKEAAGERRINDGDEITLIERDTLGKLLNSLGIEEKVTLNGENADGSEKLKSGDVIERAEEAPKETSVPPEKPTEQPPENPKITVNGIETQFPLREDGKAPIFLDVAAAFSDDPTQLLSHAGTITINGKIARLDEEIHSGDVIVIE